MYWKQILGGVLQMGMNLRNEKINVHQLQEEGSFGSCLVQSKGSGKVKTFKEKLDGRKIKCKIVKVNPPAHSTFCPGCDSHVDGRD